MAVAPWGRSGTAGRQLTPRHPRTQSAARISLAAVRHQTVVPPGEDLDLPHVDGFAQEADGAVAEAEQRPAGVPAAERLRAGAVDAEVLVIDRPEDVADEDRTGRTAVHPDPEGGD